MKKPAKRVTITEASVDCRHRKSTLRKLQRKRLEKEILAGKLSRNQRHLLSVTSSHLVPAPSEDNLASPGSTQIYEADVQLPKIHVCSNLAGKIKTSRDYVGKGFVSDDTTHRVLSGNVARDELSGDITSKINTRSNPTGSTETSRDGNMAKESVSDDITLGMLSGDVNREELSGDLTRAMLSGDITGTVLPSGRTEVLPGTNIPYSRCTDVVGERLSQGISVMARRPLDDLGMKNEALRVLPVNPKLTIDTGKCTNLLY